MNQTTRHSRKARATNATRSPLIYRHEVIAILKALATVVVWIIAVWLSITLGVLALGGK